MSKSKSRPVIYLIQNVCNGKGYVGSASRGLGSRKWLHLRQLGLGIHHSKHLQRAWNRYGAECFQWLVLETVDNLSEILKREQYWLDKLQTSKKDRGYNVSPTAGSNAGSAFYQTQEHRALMKIVGRGNAERMRAMASRPHSLERRIQSAKSSASLTDDEVRQIKDLIAAGWYAKDIAPKFNTTLGVIYRIRTGRSLAYGGVGMKDFKPKQKHTKITAEDRAKVREMHASGMTQTEIHKRTGYSQSVVSNIVRGK